MNMRRVSRGFSIIEIIIVVGIIGILASIVTISYAAIEANARDSEREAKATVIASALEEYYEENGEYPSCGSLTSSLETARSTLGGINADTLKTPTSDNATLNSIQCTTLTPSSEEDIFAYAGDNSPSCLGSESCLQWTLQYKKEFSGEVVSIQSKHKVNFATSGSSTLTLGSILFSSVTLSWSTVQNASSYTVQRSTVSNFSSGVVSFEFTGNSGNVTGLTSGVQYFFRVAPKSGGVTGAWSNTVNATTLSLQEPSITATPNSGSQITINWGAVTNATSYNLQYATNTSFSGATTISNLTGTSRAVTGLSIGPLYSFRLQARSSSGVLSGWSNTASTVTQVPVPTCSSNAKTSNNSITPSWGAVSGATYALQYATNSSYTSATNITGISTTNRTITGLLNAQTYYVRVKAIVGGSESAWGNCPSVATGINGPTGYGWYAEGYGVRARAGLPWMPGQDPGYGSTFWTNGITIYGSCSPGATVVTRIYSYYAYSNNTVPNNASLMDWTWGNQSRYVVGGSGSWYVWWQGWVACQVGSTRVGDVYLGNAGPY